MVVENTITELTRAMEPVSLEAHQTVTLVLGIKVNTFSVSITCVSLCTEIVACTVGTSHHIVSRNSIALGNGYLRIIYDVDELCLLVNGKSGCIVCPSVIAAYLCVYGRITWSIIWVSSWQVIGLFVVDTR